MTRLVIIFIVCLLLTSNSQAQNKADRQTALRSLVAAEQEFSRTSAEQGTRDAFVAFLADDGVIFNPLPANGKQVWIPREKTPGILTWEPVFADVSEAADLGFTTGPYEFRTIAGEKAIGNGYYMSVWRKDSNGVWKVALDIGTRNQPADTLPALAYPTITKKTKIKEIEVERTALAAADENFSRLLAADKSTPELNDLTGNYFRLHIMNNFPLTEKDAALTALQNFQGKINSQTVKMEIARSGDFGYSYGTYESKNQLKENAGSKIAERGSFVRVWRCAEDGKWKLMLVVMHDAPPAKRTGQ